VRWNKNRRQLKIAEPLNLFPGRVGMTARKVNHGKLSVLGVPTGGRKYFTVLY